MKKVLIIMLCCVWVVLADEKGYANIEEVKYSITPEDEEWKKLTLQEQINTCNIDEEVLKKLDTGRLLDLALDYPLACDIFLFDRLDDGLQHLIDTSTVYAELCTRKDLIGVIDSFNAIYRNDFVNKCILDTLKMYYINKIGVVGINNTRLMTNELFLKASVSNENIDNMLSASGFTPLNYSPEIRYFSPDGSVWDYVIRGTYSKYGTSVSCDYFQSHDFSTSEINAINSRIGSMHPNWTRLASATLKYNCHSYCWINSSYGNMYWVNNPGAFLSASGYVNLYGTNCPTLLNQKIVIYGTGSDGSDPAGTLQHSAIVTSGSAIGGSSTIMNSCRVESKLGFSGVYNTSLRDVYDLYGGTTYKAYNVM